MLCAVLHLSENVITTILDTFRNSERLKTSSKPQNWDSNLNQWIKIPVLHLLYSWESQYSAGHKQLHLEPKTKHRTLTKIKREQKTKREVQSICAPRRGSDHKENWNVFAQLLTDSYTNLFWPQAVNLLSTLMTMKKKNTHNTNKQTTSSVTKDSPPKISTH